MKIKDKIIKIKLGTLKSGKSLLIELKFTKHVEKILKKEYGHLAYKFMKKNKKEELIRNKKEELMEEYKK